MTTIQFNCLTYNVGGTQDTMKLMEDNADRISDEKIKNLIAAYKKDARPFEEPAKLFREVAENHYKALTERVVPGILEQSQADFICFQELYVNNTEKKQLGDKVKAAGYELYGDRDVAVAFKKDKYKFIQQGITNNQRGALFVDVQDKKSGKIIRIVSDHVAGFGVQGQKNTNKSLRENKNLITGEPLTERERKGAEENKKTPRDGDANLGKTLKKLNRKTTGLWARISNFFFKDPDVIVCGLDANATAKYVDKEFRAHPKRLRQFEAAGYICDQNDKRPTILDHGDNKPRKYDYIFVKPQTGQAQITSRPLDIELGNYQKSLSDHIPVVAQVKVDFPARPSRWEVLSSFIGSFFSSIFSRK